MWKNIKDKTVGIILRRKLSYMDVFKGVASEIVMKDLSKFCNAFTTSVKSNLTTGSIDPLQMAFEEGKRAVLNRIKYYANLDDEQIYKYYKDLEE